MPIEYDPLLAKLAVWAGTRDEAIGRMIRALREYDVGGIRTNIGFFRQILEDPEFRAGQFGTKFMERFSTTQLREYLAIIRDAILDGQSRGVFRSDLNPTVAAKLVFDLTLRPASLFAVTFEP